MIKQKQMHWLTLVALLLFGRSFLISPLSATGLVKAQTVQKYKSEYYGFQFEYPSDWYMAPLQYNVGGDHLVIANFDIMQSRESSETIELPIAIYLVVEPNSSMLAIEEWLIHREAYSLVGKQILSEKSQEINGISLITRELEGNYGRTLATYWTNDDKVFILNMSATTIQARQMYQQILSTLNIFPSSGPKWNDVTIIDENYFKANAPRNPFHIESQSFLKFPFPCNETWRISNGYWDDPVQGHYNVQYSRYALDFVNTVANQTYNKPLLAAHNGKVIARNWDDTGGGWTIKVDADGISGGYVTFYSHLISQSPIVPDTWVSQGDEIGRVGDTGNVTGPHIHFALWNYNSGIPGFESVKPEPMSGHTGFLYNQSFTSDNCGGGCIDVAPVGQDSSRQQLFVDAYNRNGGKDGLGCTENAVHWWNTEMTIQDFTGTDTTGDAIIVHNEYRDNPPHTIPAFVVHGGILNHYFSHVDAYGPPTSDEFVNQQGYPQSNFANGYVTWQGEAFWHTWPTAFAQWKAEYYNNIALIGFPTMVRNENVDKPNCNWGENAPESGHIGVFANRFSVRWTRTINFTAGLYRFSTHSDDGVRVWIDNNLIIDHWVDGGEQNHTGEITLSEGTHTVKIEYYENGGFAYFSIDWELISPTSQVAMAIDAPKEGANVEGNVTVGGWAIDHASASETGVSKVHIYLDGTAGGGGIGLGAAAYGGDRSDVAAVYGSQFRYSGYSYSWNSNATSLGDHTLYVYVYSTIASGWSHYQRNVHVVDTTPPSLVSNLRPNGWMGPYTKDNTPAFTWDSAIDARGIAGYYIALNDWTPDGDYGTDWAIDNVISWAVPDSNTLADGSHFVAITSRDNSGLVNPSNTNTQGDAPYYEFVVDTIAPASTMSTLPKTITDPTFTLSWSGGDNGSGIATYDVQVREAKGTWRDLLIDTTRTTKEFTGQFGHTYYFRCRAADLAGNLEAWPNDDGDTYTYIKGFRVFLPISSLSKE